MCRQEGSQWVVPIAQSKARWLAVALSSGATSKHSSHGWRAHQPWREQPSRGARAAQRDYVLKSFNYGSKTISLYCLQASSTDYDLTGQIVWPGAELLNNFLAQGKFSLEGLSILELGSGVGLTGLLCGHYCQKIVMTDHNTKVLEVLQRNIDLQESSNDGHHHAIMVCEKLEWGNDEQLSHILEKHPEGFDLILGADICYQQDSLSFMFRTVNSLLSREHCPAKKFILSYVSRAKSLDAALLREAKNLKLDICEIAGTRTRMLNGILEGTLFEEAEESWGKFRIFQIVYLIACQPPKLMFHETMMIGLNRLYVPGFLCT